MIDGLTIICGDALSELKKLPDKSIQCCVTSPPYYGLRDYKVNGQIGLESSPSEYVLKLVSIFHELNRVLRDDGTFWLNLGDTYAGSWGAMSYAKGSIAARRFGGDGEKIGRPVSSRMSEGMKQKDLIGIPWRVAFALQADGWYLRSDIIWAKRNCMPESVTDRPTRSHEYIFLLSKSARYYYDHEAIKEPCIYDVDGTGTEARKARASVELKSHPTAERAGIRPGGYKNSVNFDGKNKGNEKQRGHSRRHDGFNGRWDNMEREEQCTGMRNKRDVWTVSPANYPEAHFATFPKKLITPCVLAGCPVGGTVLDPFAGSGTTGEVCLENRRKAVLIELNPEYIKLIEKRCDATQVLLV